jgi:hypothetical protein
MVKPLNCEIPETAPHGCVGRSLAALARRRRLAALPNFTLQKGEQARHITKEDGAVRLHT